MYKRFKKTIENIIEKYGDKKTAQEFLSQDVRLKVYKKGFMDFSIEKCGDRLFVGYYTEINGDLVSDPIFVFDIRNDTWFPIRLEQILGDTDIGLIEGDEYKFNNRRFNDIMDFALSSCREWNDYYLVDTDSTSVVLRD